MCTYMHVCIMNIYIYIQQQMQTHSLREELEVKAREVKVLQKSLEEKDAELQRLAQHIAAQEARLQQMTQSAASHSNHTRELQLQIDILSELTESRSRLAEAEDERHRAEMKVTLSQREASYQQKHAPVLDTNCSSVNFPQENEPPTTRFKLTKNHKVYIKH